MSTVDSARRVEAGPGGLVCEKCWADAVEIAKTSKRTLAVEYLSLVRSRRSSPCTPDEQAGITPAPEPEPVVETELSEAARRMLDFERQWWRVRGNKDRAITAAFALKSTEYYRLLNGLVDNAFALAYAPDVIHRLDRLRSTRRWRMA